MNESHRDRRRPHHDVRMPSWVPALVYLTVCTKDRRPWLACEPVHSLLRGVWSESQTWLTGPYVIMPDHIHLIAAYNGSGIPLEDWVRYWKSRFSLAYGHCECRWQSGYWDTTLRSGESCTSKWLYMRENPVRAGLVQDSDDWPYLGDIHNLA